MVACWPVPTALRLECELSLDRIVVAQIDVDSDGLVFHPECRSLCDIGGRAGYCRKDAVD